jgi:hypothetical protein
MLNVFVKKNFHLTHSLRVVVAIRQMPRRLIQSSIQSAKKWPFRDFKENFVWIAVEAF